MSAINSWGDVTIYQPNYLAQAKVSGLTCGEVHPFASWDFEDSFTHSTNLNDHLKNGKFPSSSPIINFQCIFVILFRGPVGMNQTPLQLEVSYPFF